MEEQEERPPKALRNVVGHYPHEYWQECVIDKLLPLICHPEVSFDTIKDFDESKLPRTCIFLVMLTEADYYLIRFDSEKAYAHVIMTSAFGNWVPK